MENFQLGYQKNEKKTNKKNSTIKGKINLKKNKN
jgi:hypothetical protein